MKKTIFFFPLVSTALVACAHKDQSPPPGNGNTTVIIPDDECPRRDGQPCK